MVTVDQTPGPSGAEPPVTGEAAEQSIVIEQSGAGLCVPWGVETFAEAVASILSMPVAMRQSLGWTDEISGCIVHHAIDCSKFSFRTFDNILHLLILPDITRDGEHLSTRLS